MAVFYNLQDGIFSLNTEHTTYQMKVDTYGYLLHLYYGTKTHGNMEYLLKYQDRGFSGNPYVAGSDRTYSLDTLPQEYPTLGSGDFRNYAISIENEKGCECCSLLYQSHTITSGKYALPGLPTVWAEEEEAETLEIVLADPILNAEVHLLYGVLEQMDVITRSVIIKNCGEETFVIKKAAAAALDFVNGVYDIVKFYGKHTMERNMERMPLGHGTVSFGSRRGTSSHQYNPAVILAERQTTEDSGDCYGMLFAYSGNFLCEAQTDQFENTRVILGLSDELFSYPVDAGEEFVVPEAILSYSAEGFSGLSRQYHDCIRNHVCRGSYVHKSRPVLINSWEAAYFDFTGDTIVNLAREAASLGIDMVVMDDGWFGKREDDNSSLGDWVVNEEKLGGSLAALIERVHSEGVKFGIWIEPEMVNEDSNLYRTHPDWAIQISGRKPIRSRNQLILDFSRKEIRDHVFAQICEVLDQGKIDYVKWDMNRSMTDVYDGKLTYDYVLGVYEFLEKLTQRYPDMLIEGCSGGGGRFDAGMMYYTPQIWCSDNTDAINRMRIQYGSSFFYPISVVGSHVSAVPNHQTGRITSLKTRGITAMAGTFGYELNPAQLKEEEKEEIREQIQIYKKYEQLINEGTYYRLSNPFSDEVSAWMSVSKTKEQALISVVRLLSESNAHFTYVKAKGLKADAVYLEKNSGAIYTGTALMKVGIVLPQAQAEYEAYQFVLKEMKVADKLYAAIREKTEKMQLSGKIVVSLFGGYGSGKSTLAEILKLHYTEDGIMCCSLSGDHYPRRTPKRNDEERMRIFREEGIEGLKQYLGTEKEIEFDAVNQVIADFKNGKNIISIKNMGREDGEISYYDVDFTQIQVLLLEWTHGGNERLKGVDIPVYLHSTPQEMRNRRVRRMRDENAGSDFITKVLDIEQEKLLAQAQKAVIKVGKDEEIYE